MLAKSYLSRPPFRTEFGIAAEKSEILIGSGRRDRARVIGPDAKGFMRSVLNLDKSICVGRRKKPKVRTDRQPDRELRTAPSTIREHSARTVAMCLPMIPQDQSEVLGG